ncbi:RDD family protein [Luteimicrobium sp. DT211]|uniref:RDD family protein n=1 Tax=Luteimicrobium sp. DT211 TaxID=3393412 RepID=UPI003CF8BF47
MTLCQRCGGALPPGAGLCPSCGAPVLSGVPSGHTTERLVPGSVPGDVRQVSMPAALTAHTLPGFPTAPPTPTGPVPAPLGRRVLAWLIDAVVIGIPAAVAVAVMLPGVLDKGDDAASGTTALTPSDLFPLQAVAWGLTLVAGLVLVSFEGTTGRTVGKLALGLRTQDVATGRPIGVARGIVRGLVFGAFALLCWVGEILVLLSPVFDSSPRRQGWQDKAARAVVVSVEPAAPAPRPGPGAAAMPAAPAAPAPAPAPYAGVPPFTPAPPYGAAPQSPAQPTPSGGWAPPAAPAPGAAAPAVQAMPGLVTGIPGAGAPAAPPAAAGPPAVAAPGFDLGLPDGSTVRVTGPTLLGRDPAVPPSQAGPAPQLVAVPDPGRSVSKTHAELGVDASGLWLVDRGSTNGTTVEAPGAAPVTAEPGRQVRVPAGATVRLGDAAVVVHGDLPDESTVISARRPPSAGGSW